MMNQVMIVGRLADNPEVKELESANNFSKITLIVNRSYKNAEGIYDSDFIDCILWEGIANNVAEYCHKGDVIGVRGRLETFNYEDENGEKKKNMRVVAEKVTFLSSKSEDIKKDIDKKEQE